MRPLHHDGFLSIRVAEDVRADLDQAARARGEKRSAMARRALAAGLAVLRGEGAPGETRRIPPGPGASIGAAA